ncbi:MULTISPECIES: ATP-binding protein [Actinomadura]|uniref:Serine/threonine-protein kinase RsbW n=1 Tax=Actinomadura madurae TaxID=1993 RepID=A0A1I5U2U8_9ACTN|nr:ATP-binding protein [Actinomadura madurae]MCP9951839.1 ATP-binding protein [Actinomadura madurae]MCP9968610.1 ATP-binding protein [Actinomadura madurae]MCQ0007421.1 ATP-binding protein [Actinomadura madurae]MCQ0017279.1 ATP-binding protein [Actinomadura madurae]URM97117.1 ATP-binding protein [Actinomadura madurae]
MEVVLEMTLPRNAESAPLVRHTLDASLRGLGVGSEIRADIALALGEACANVIQHAAAGMEYEVRARMDGARCVVDVIDGGTDDAAEGADGWEGAQAPPLAEHGRGLRLMRAFTEDLRIAARDRSRGSVVHFEKSLAG